MFSCRNVKLLGLCLFAILPSAMAEQLVIPGAEIDLRPAPDQAAADDMWREVSALRVPPGGEADAVEKIKREERRRREYRERGLQFYDTFNDDARRWEWLLATHRLPPRYWKDLDQGARALISKSVAPEIDQPARDKWEALLRDFLQPALMASSQVTVAQRAEWYEIEMAHRQREDDERAKRGEKPDIDRFMQALLIYAAQPAADDYKVYSQFGTLWYRFEQTGVGLRARAPFLDRLDGSANPRLRRLVEGKRRVLALQDTPMELQLESLAGQRIDVARWRGKVVLLDFWSTTCSTCIDNMPVIKAVYDRYHASGFEVAAIAHDTDRDKVQTVLRKLGIPWPTAMQPLANSEFPDKYAMTSIGLYFLLDQNGRLVTTDIGHGKDSTLEQQVRVLLGI